MGVRRIFAQISPELARKLLGHLLCVAWRQNFGWPTKKRLHVTLGAIFSNQSTLDVIFACIFGEFAQIFRDFEKVFTDFAQISLNFARIFTKSKLLGVHLHPRLLHHWTEVFILLKQKKLEQKKRIVNYYGRHNMNETRWFQVSVSCWRLETISINVLKTPVEYFEYTAAPRRWPPRYHDHFNAVFPIR